MLEHSLARAIAACAPGKRVTITFASGKTVALPIVPEPVPIPPPHPLEVLSQQLLERDAEMLATVAAVSARADETLEAVKAAVDTVAAGQAEITESVKELEGTLHLPVRPVYDRSGKLIGAQRVKQLGA